MTLQRRKHFLSALILCIFFAACPAYCSTYYVATNGSDSNSGTITAPFKTITKGVSSAAAGDTIYLRGGRHYYSAKISISKVGTSSAKYNLIAYPGERPILDFSAMAYDSTNRGISLSGQYWYIKGLDIYKAGDNGMNISGSNNIIEFCAFYENCDTGLQLGGGAANNQIINCDSYYNYDYLTTPEAGGNADGFSPKLDVGTGNYFYGCRSWQNSDDAYDGYLNASVDVNTTYENCWAFKAGHLKDGSDCNGNGNGFKMGSSATSSKHNVILKNCLSFQNKAKGFDQNHNKGSMTLYNCTSFNNGDYNYSIYEALASGKTATLLLCTLQPEAISLTGEQTLICRTTAMHQTWAPSNI
ncbi:MAG: right-handed parallel beta-helix repeat-containing protein [Phycisphaerae bacterium]|nr:right-handed parallel beta-helix repeat-containing protein [Phycisphaerae bacterium]